ncbi:hypothetical protein EVAR_40633_1 [Eumeta japonica]|uniref:Uncharacterized protein n=1 Tax=Eumeta variegata TaxID=151549 RepID=A0A4C1X2Z9_EUMVA|nr:hypothetical protein EVAR_40633_1 [Eumeta japonica]
MTNAKTKFGELTVRLFRYSRVSFADNSVPGRTCDGRRRFARLRAGGAGGEAGGRRAPGPRHAEEAMKPITQSLIHGIVRIPIGARSRCLRVRRSKDRHESFATTRCSVVNIPAAVAGRTTGSARGLDVAAVRAARGPRPVLGARNSRERPNAGAPSTPKSPPRPSRADRPARSQESKRFLLRWVLEHGLRFAVQMSAPFCVIE